jgi:hypothetical protein
MSAICLPDEPSFEQVRNQAKDLRRAVLAGRPEALAEVAERFPGGAPDPFPLHTAQLVVARRYGFPSWARQGPHRHAQRPALADGAAQGGRGREP